MSQRDFLDTVRVHFDAVCTQVLDQLQGDEAATLNLCAEESLFVRFNNNRVRQATQVQQMTLALQLQAQGRTTQASRTLSGHLGTDGDALAHLLDQCRQELRALPADPHQVPIENHGSSDETFRGQLLAAADVVAAIVGPAQGCDMAGLYAGGTIVRANCNSAGQRHWFATQSFFMDYSLYHGARAVKGSYAASDWDGAQWAANLAHSQHLLALMDKPLQTVPPANTAPTWPHAPSPTWWA